MKNGWNLLGATAAICLAAGVLAGCKTRDISRGPIAGQGLTDGVYEGTGTDTPVKVVARVTIENQRLTEITLLKHRTWRGGAAEKAIPGRIIQAQSTRVDAVTGATISSRAIMKAVQDAVAKAQNKTAL